MSGIYNCDDLQNSNCSTLGVKNLQGLEPAWNISEEANQDRDPASSKDTTRQGMGTKSRIDSIARVLFPAAFLVFVVIYAIIYMI